MANAEDSLFCQIFGSGCTTGTTFTSTTTTFGNGSNGNRATAGADAQYGSNVTWDYFKAVHGRNGIWNDGRGSYNRVHYGNGYVNAFWDGTKMTYGDGDGVDFGPLVSLDVAGHEMTHGVTENSANLTYSGESGGLNESTSDIFGTMVEFYAANANDPADYLIGEEFDLKNHARLPPDGPPVADGSSPNCWSSNAKNVDVHYSSGIGNHFFYLLAEGSGAKTIGGVAHSSTTCNGSSVTGIGRDAAGEDLVPRADGLHDLQHHLRRCAHRHAQRRAGPLRRRLGAAEHRRRRVERGLGRLIRPGRPDRTSEAWGRQTRRARAATTDAPTTTTRNGIRSSSATTAKPSPSTRASRVSAVPPEKTCTATSAASSATGIRSATRSTVGWLSTRSGQREPGELEQVAADAGQQRPRSTSAVTSRHVVGAAGPRSGPRASSSTPTSRATPPAASTGTPGAVIGTIDSATAAASTRDERRCGGPRAAATAVRGTPRPRRRRARRSAGRRPPRRRTAPIAVARFHSDEDRHPGRQEAEPGALGGAAVDRHRGRLVDEHVRGGRPGASRATSAAAPSAGRRGCCGCPAAARSRRPTAARRPRRRPRRGRTGSRR